MSAAVRYLDARVVLFTNRPACCKVAYFFAPLVFLNPGGRCVLYALTWRCIDYCPGKDLEVNPTTTPPLKLSMLNPRIPGPVSVPG